MKRYGIRIGVMIPLLLLLALGLSGCWSFSADSNIENAKALRVGMTKEQVLEIMGKPLDARFATDDLWYYYTESRWFDGQATRDECMPLVFKDGKLAGWGNTYYNRLRMVEQDYIPPVIEGLR